MTPLDEAYGQQQVADETDDQLPILIRLIEIKPIDRIGIIENDESKLKRTASKTQAAWQFAHRRSAPMIITAPPRITTASSIAAWIWIGSRATSARAKNAPGNATQPISTATATT